MRYLADKFSPGTIYPKDLQKRALVDFLLDFDLGTFDKAVHAYQVGLSLAKIMWYLKVECVLGEPYITS